MVDLTSSTSGTRLEGSRKTTPIKIINTTNLGKQHGLGGKEGREERKDPSRLQKTQRKTEAATWSVLSAAKRTLSAKTTQVPCPSAVISFTNHLFASTHC